MANLWHAVLVSQHVNKTYLNITDRQTNKQVHEDNTDKYSKDENHGVAGERVQCFPVFVNEVLVLDLTGHHDKRFYDGSRHIDVKALKKKKRNIVIIQFLGRMLHRPVPIFSVLHLQVLLCDCGSCYVNIRVQLKKAKLWYFRGGKKFENYRAKINDIFTYIHKGLSDSRIKQ